MQSVRKISAILLSLLVLFSSTSFTYSMHLCMGQVESVALFKEAKTCEMAPRVNDCTKSSQASHSENLKQKDCCADQTLLIEGQDELVKINSVSIPDVQMVAVLYAAISFLFDASSVHNYLYQDYSPPLIERDIPVLVQSFLL